MHTSPAGDRPATPDDLILLTEAATLTGCHPATLRRRIQEGTLHGWAAANKRILVSRRECESLSVPQPLPATKAKGGAA